MFGMRPWGYVLLFAVAKRVSRVQLIMSCVHQFGKVFVINLKDRTDKLDAMHLASSLTGFHVEAIEAVRGVDISEKSIPSKGVPEVR